MPGPLARWLNAFRDKDADLHRMVGEIDNHFAYIYAQLGTQGPKFQDQPQAPTAPLTPPTASFVVTGDGGVFQISIVNPQQSVALTPQLAKRQARAGVNLGGAQLYHNLQSASSPRFDVPSDLADYGVSTQTAFSFRLPGQALYWRLRSSFDGKTWNEWQVFRISGGVGATVVSSGS